MLPFYKAVCINNSTLQTETAQRTSHKQTGFKTSFSTWCS